MSGNGFLNEYMNAQRAYLNRHSRVSSTSQDMDGSVLDSFVGSVSAFKPSVNYALSYQRNSSMSPGQGFPGAFDHTSPRHDLEQPQHMLNRHCSSVNSCQPPVYQGSHASALRYGHPAVSNHMPPPSSLPAATSVSLQQVGNPLSVEFSSTSSISRHLFSYGVPVKIPDVMLPRKKHGLFHCESCDKPFSTQDDLEMHVTEKHVFCTVPGCMFNGRPELMIAHKMTHLKSDRGDGQDNVTNCSVESEEWLKARRSKHPLGNSKGKQPDEIEMGKLERAIRYGMRQAIMLKKEMRERRLAEGGGGNEPCAFWVQKGKCRYGEKCKFFHKKEGICEYFKNHGQCRHGSTCKYEHVSRREVRRRERMGMVGGVMKKKSLIEKLEMPEVKKFENTVLQVFRYLVNENFFDEGDTSELISVDNIGNDSGHVDGHEGNSDIEEEDDLFVDDGFSGDDDSDE